jgi:hypothetical protein
VSAGEESLTWLSEQLVVVGSVLMDVYTGQLAPNAIAQKVVAGLTADNRLALDVYKPWVAEGGGYRVLTFEDQSQWVLRLGDEAGRYVHVHPGRWVPQTQRVRANVLKTAIMVLAYCGVHGGDPLDVKLINAVRTKYLGLSPIGSVDGNEGLGVVLAMLQK